MRKKSRASFKETSYLVYYLLRDLDEYLSVLWSYW